MKLFSTKNNRTESNREDAFHLTSISIVIILSLIGFFFINKLFLLIFFAANMFHVTRQSFGVCKLYCKEIDENKFQDNQVLVQAMANDVSMSGVLFTKDMNSGAPYYVINYDDEDDSAGGW